MVNIIVDDLKTYHGATNTSPNLQLLLADLGKNRVFFSDEHWQHGLCVIVTPDTQSIGMWLSFDDLKPTKQSYYRYSYSRLMCNMLYVIGANRDIM